MRVTAFGKGPTETELQIDFQAMKFSWKQRPTQESQEFGGDNLGKMREYESMKYASHNYVVMLKITIPRVLN